MNLLEETTGDSSVLCRNCKAQIVGVFINVLKERIQSDLDQIILKQTKG